MCFPNGELEIEILADGTVKVTSGKIGGAEHMTAEKFLRWLSAELGGPSSRVKRPHAHAHHEHAHEVKQK